MKTGDVNETLDGGKPMTRGDSSSKSDNKKPPTKKKEGDKEYSEDSKIIPEELQKEAIALLEKCKTTACTSYIRDLCYKKDEELRKSDDEFTTVGGPSYD